MFSAQNMRRQMRNPVELSGWRKRRAQHYGALGTMQKGCVLAQSGKASEAIQMITSGITMYRSTGSRLYLPVFLSHLSRAYAELGQFDQAWRCIGEAMAAVETRRERWHEAEID